MKKIALIVAAGKGVRMRTELPKQFLKLNNLPVLMHTINLFIHFDKIYVVISKEQSVYWKKLCEKYNFSVPHTICSGGKSRFESVKNGLKKISEKNSIVAIHDGARPFASKNIIDKLMSVASDGVGAIPILKITDSIRKKYKLETVSVDRKKYFTVQTPQCFILKNIQDAYKKMSALTMTDDASVFEKYGGKIELVEGEENNIKITTQKDFKFLEWLYNDL